MPPGQTPNPPKPPKPAWFEHGTSVWPRCPPGAPGQEEGRDDHPSQSSSLLSLPVPPQHSLVVRFWSVLCHWTFSRPPTLDEAPTPHWSVMVKSWIYSPGSQAKMLSASTSPLSPWLPSLRGQPEAPREKSIALSPASRARLSYSQIHASPGEMVCNGAENIDRTQRKACVCLSSAAAEESQ